MRPQLVHLGRARSAGRRFATDHPLEMALQGLAVLIEPFAVEHPVIDRSFVIQLCAAKSAFVLISLPLDETTTASLRKLLLRKFAVLAAVLIASSNSCGNFFGRIIDVFKVPSFSKKSFSVYHFCTHY